MTYHNETNEGHIEFQGRDNFRINSFMPIVDATKADFEHEYQESQAILKIFGVLLMKIIPRNVVVTIPLQLGAVEGGALDL